MWEEELNYCHNAIIKLTKAEYCKVYLNVEIDYWKDIVIWLYNDFISNETPKEILDVGCGYGTLSVFCKRLFNTNITSIDITRHLDKNVEKFFNIDYHLMDVELDPLPDKKYNKIIITEVLEHLYFNPTSTLKKLYQKLNDDGCIYLSTPDSDSLWGKIDKFYKTIEDMPLPGEKIKPEFSTIDEHIYQYNFKELKQIFKDSGFIIKNFSRTNHKDRGNHICVKLKKNK